MADLALFILVGLLYGIWLLYDSGVIGYVLSIFGYGFWVLLDMYDQILDMYISICLINILVLLDLHYWLPADTKLGLDDYDY